MSNINLETERLKQTLKLTINNSNLPIVIVKYILEDLTKEIQQLYKQNILQSIQQEKQKTEEQPSQD